MDKEIKTTKSKQVRYVGTVQLKCSRFSVLPEDVQKIGRDAINDAKAGKPIAIEGKPNLFYFKEVE